MKPSHKTMITRITSFPGYDGVLGGRDLARVFKPGHVYEFHEIMGEITCKDLGEICALSRYRDNGNTIGQIFVEGFYLLTKAEGAAQKKAENDD